MDVIPKTSTMKKKFLFFILWMTGYALEAQPVLEHIYSESVNICRLESVGEVYYSMDVMNHQCHIYRMDHTLYKSVAIPIPEGYYHSDVQFVSESLFNEDPLIELVYSYTRYVPTETSYYYTYETKVVNEHGTLLLTVPGAGYTNVIEVPGQGKKFLVYEYNYSVIPYRTYTHVFSLPETDTTETGAPDQVSTLEVPRYPFPNPADHQVHIPVMLPEGIQSGTLELFDLNGKMVMSHPVTGSTGNLVLPTHQLVPGTYIYQVDLGHMRLPSKKIVIR